MKLLQVLFVAAVIVFAVGSLFGQSALDVTGRIIDCSNSRPIPNAIIQLDATANAVITDSDGRFYIYGLKAGAYSIQLSAPAYYSRADMRLVVNEDFSSEYTFCLEPRLYRAEPQQVAAKVDADRQKVITLDRGSPEFKSSGSMGDLLDHVPDLIVNRMSGKSGEATVSVRGGPSKEVLVLVDGVSINSPITGIADINSIPLSSIAKVEFYEGGASSQFGAGAVGGVLNIETGTSYSISELCVEGMTGQYNTRSFDGSARIHYDKIGSFSGVYSGYTATNDFMFDDQKTGIVRRENTDIKRINGNLAGEIEIGNERDIRLSYHRFEQDNGLPGFIYRLNPTARKDETRDIFSAIIENSTVSPSYAVRYSYRKNAQAFQDTFSYNKINSKYLDGLHQLNLDAGFILPNDTKFDFSTTAGYETFEVENLINPDAVFEDVIDKRTSIVMSAGKGWTHRSDTYSYGMDILLRTRGDYSNLFAPMYSPSVHVGSSFSRWFKLHGELSYGKSYRAPLYSSLFWNDGVFAIGNPNLLPEHLEESSAGINLTLPFLGEFQVEAQYTHSAYQDLIFWHRTHDSKFTPRNLSGAVVFTRSLNLHWALRPLNITLDYSNQDQISKDRSWKRTHHDQQLTFRPRYLQHFSARYINRYVDLQYRLRCVSKRFIRPANTKWLDGYKIADLSVALKYELRWVGFRLQYDLNNITNADYMLIERYPMPAQTWGISAKLTFPLGIS